MFGIGVSELLLILLIAFLVLGPEKSIILSRTLGRLVAGLKKKTDEAEKVVLAELGKLKSAEPPPDGSEKKNGKQD